MVAVVVAVTELPDVLVDCPDCAIPSVSDCCSTAKACCVAVFICSTAVKRHRCSGRFGQTVDEGGDDGRPSGVSDRLRMIRITCSISSFPTTSSDSLCFSSQDLDRFHSGIGRCRLSFQRPFSCSHRIKKILSPAKPEPPRCSFDLQAGPSATSLGAPSLFTSSSCCLEYSNHASKFPLPAKLAQAWKSRPSAKLFQIISASFRELDFKFQFLLFP